MFRLATENCKQLKLSKTNIESAIKETDVIKNSRLPSVGASISASYLGDGIIMDRDFTNSTAAPMPHFGNDFALEASQVIFTGGAISNRIAKAKLEEQIAQLNFEKEQMDVRFLLTGYYLDLYKSLNQREVYVKNIEQINLLIKQIKAKQQEGMALSNDVTRHELMLQNIELALIEIDNNCKIFNNQLITILGMPDSTVIKPDSTILNLDLDNANQVDLLQSAELNLPELKSATINLQVAEKNIKIAKAGYLPSVALIAANNFNGPITIEVPPINKNLNYWYAGLGLKYNISSLYTSKRCVNLAKNQQDVATDTKSVIEEQSMLNVQNTFIKYKESFDKLHTLEKSLQLATENYNVINYRYLNNLVLITEMLDASNTKLNAELQVANARINIVFNYYKLKHITGTL
ncbi:MAG: TolC family protein [Bacteroidales bacterium]|nr:TolC family protein [Bacteroidales bacterium]